MISPTPFERRRRFVPPIYALMFFLSYASAKLMAKAVEFEKLPPAKAQHETENQSEFDVDDYLGGTEVYETQERGKIQFESNFLLGKDLFPSVGDWNTELPIS